MKLLIISLLLFPFVVEAVEKEVVDFAITKLAAVYEVDESLARRIIKCESGGNANAISKTKDYGLWQINAKYHEKPAKALGYNIYRWQENLEFGFLLFSRDGESHWRASRFCWSAPQKRQQIQMFQVPSGKWVVISS